MPPWYLADISLWIVTVLVGLIGFVMAFRGLVGDRARGRPTCWQCRYDMTNLDTLTCPECGHQHDRRSRLFKTRRHYGRFLVGALVFMLALHCHTGPQVQYRRTTLGEHWWEAVVPTTVWIIMLPKLDHERVAFLDQRVWLPEPTLHAQSTTLFGGSTDDDLDDWFEVPEDIPARPFSLSDWQTRRLVNAAIECLADSSAPNHILMDWIIAARGRLDVLDELLVLCSNPKPEVRRLALLEAGMDERTDRIMPMLLAATGDPSAQVRLAAFTALGRMGARAKDALPSLQAALTDPANEAIADLGGFYGADHTLADIAALALVRIDPDAGYALFTSEVPFSSRLRKSAMKAIWYAPPQYSDLKWAAAINGAMEGDRFFSEVLIQTKGMKLDVRFHIPAARALLDALRDPDRDKRSLARDTLYKTGAGLLPILNWAIEQDDQELIDDIVGLMIHLGESASPLTHKVARVMLRDPPRFRGLIMDMLAHTGPPSKEVLAVLREATGHDNADIREMASFTLELLTQ